MSDTIAVTVRLPAATKRTIDALKPIGFTVDSFIREAVDAHLKRFPHVLDPEALARAVSHA